MSAVIRHATPGDAPVVLQMIRDLAEHEGLADEVVATEGDLRDSLAADPPHAEVVIAEIDGSTAGFALFFHNYSTFHCRRGLYLEDLYVRPEFRRRGVGTELLRHLARLAVDRSCARLEWWVLGSNTEAVAFYRKLGAVAMSDWTVQRVTGPTLRRLAGQNGT
ncbi:MAG: GNAT family N-acetyltransferase [Gemmatimonadales bacterium]